MDSQTQLLLQALDGMARPGPTHPEHVTAIVSYSLMLFGQKNKISHNFPTATILSTEAFHYFIYSEKSSILLRGRVVEVNRIILKPNLYKIWKVSTKKSLDHEFESEKK